MARAITPIKVRFWRQVKKTTKCWEWTGQRQGRGYGFFFPDGTAKGRKVHGGTTAHRMAWRLQRGEIPRGLLVCHKCDNKLCVRPAHLFLGTHQDNLFDMFRKGGLDRFKLTVSHVDKIRRRHSAGEGAESLSKSFGVARITIRNLIDGETWKRPVYDLMKKYRPRPRGGRE